MKGHGVGLGLSIVSGIMRSHGGDIRVADTSERAPALSLSLTSWSKIFAYRLTPGCAAFLLIILLVASLFLLSFDSDCEGGYWYVVRDIFVVLY